MFYELAISIVLRLKIKKDLNDLKFQEDKLREYRRDKRKEKKNVASDMSDSASGIDPDMAAIMGFSGFGSSSKKN